MEKIFKILKGYPFIVVGIILILFGANAFSYYHVKIDDLIWRTIVAIIGVLLFIPNVLFAFHDNFFLDKSLKKNYGLEIDVPEKGEHLNSPIKIAGRYKTKPPENLIKAIEYNPAHNRYYPKEDIIYEEENKKWYTIVHIGNGDSQPRVIKIAAVGKDGLAMIDYYKKVLSSTQKYVGLNNLTRDIKIICEVKIWLNAEE